MEIAARTLKIEASKTLQVKEKALQLKSKGVDVVDLTAGEPDSPTPPHVCQAGIDAINSGFTRYTANTGIPELRKTIAAKLKRENNLAYSPDQIIVSNGAKQSILNALFSIVEDGDEVLVSAPYWVSYPEQIKLTGAIPVIFETADTQFKITPGLLEKYINSKSRAIILNSPNNPTGVVHTPEELRDIANILKDKELWIISDEIYEKILFDNLKHTSIASFDNLIEKTIVINGLSKSFSMTGWRIGYAAGPQKVVKAMAKIQSHYTSNASSISQMAALAALTGSQDDVKKMCNIFEERRNFVLSKLNSRDYLSYINPQGAFYILIKISDTFGCRIGNEIIDNSIKFATYFAENYHLVTVPGIAFGADEYIRISFATSLSQLEKGIQLLIEGMDQLMDLK